MKMLLSDGGYGIMRRVLLCYDVLASGSYMRIDGYDEYGGVSRGC